MKITDFCIKCDWLRTHGASLKEGFPEDLCVCFLKWNTKKRQFCSDSYVFKPDFEPPTDCPYRLEYIIKNES